MMGRRKNLRNVIATIKDKASQSKAAIVSDSLHLSILKATTHEPFTSPKHITALLSFGCGSRATAASIIEALMDRLQSTRDSTVAIKCLVVVHQIIKHGSFILQDQLSVYPTNGGRNYLKLSNFRDGSSALTWQLSSWVRWYARYLETLLSKSRILGFFLSSTSSNTPEKEKQEEKVSSLTNCDLLHEIDALVTLLEEISKRPDECLHANNILVDEVLVSVSDDYVVVLNDVSIKINELINERLSYLSFGDSVELVCLFKRLECCKEPLMGLCNGKNGFWRFITEMKGIVEGLAYREGGRLTKEGCGCSGESARFGERVTGLVDSFKFHSTRFGLKC